MLLPSTAMVVKKSLVDDKITACIKQIRLLAGCPDLVCINNMDKMG